MKDFLNRPLEVGDSVIFVEPGTSKHLKLGRIEKLNPKTAKVLYQSRGYDYTTKSYGKITSSSHRSYGELVKVDGPTLTMYLLTK